jgi:hypothetical protein
MERPRLGLPPSKVFRKEQAADRGSKKILEAAFLIAEGGGKPGTSQIVEGWCVFGQRGQ